MQYIFARNAMILQGLLDRTPVMEPLPGRVNLFDPDQSKNVVYIRDAELTLGDGRLPFAEWTKNINDQLHPGSRIYFSLELGSESFGWRSKDRAERFLFYANDYPRPPESGVYQLVGTDQDVKIYGEKCNLRIMYNPGDEVGTRGWEWNPHTRKNNVSFLIRTNDAFIINVDQISPDDILYYLNNRIARKDYLRMIPLLWGVLDFVKSEREKEKHFVSLVAGRLNVFEGRVWDAVSWWKFKNQWKRSISDDDPKALRMIEKRIRAVSRLV